MGERASRSVLVGRRTGTSLTSTTQKNWRDLDESGNEECVHRRTHGSGPLPRRRLSRPRKSDRCYPNDVSWSRPSLYAQDVPVKPGALLAHE